MDFPWWAWAAVLAVILAMLAIDLFARRNAHVVSGREAAIWSVVWVSLGLAFGGVVWWVDGAQAGGEYHAGYLIEKSLAVDTVLVFALMFTYFARHRPLRSRDMCMGARSSWSRGRSVRPGPRTLIPIQARFECVVEGRGAGRDLAPDPAERRSRYGQR